MEETKTKETTAKKESVTRPAEIVEYNDLCTTCNCLPECDSTNAGRRPVYFCEQFDDYTPKKSTTKPKESSIVTSEKLV